MLQTEIIIEAGREKRGYWKELWRYRELLYFLSWRDILVRYKQAVFGIAWAVVRPGLTMLAFTFIFSKVAGLTSQGVPYNSYVLAGMLPWQFFSDGLSDSGLSLVTNANLVSKIYFPRILVPMSALVVNLVDMAIGFTLLAPILIWQGLSPSWHLLLVLPFVALAFFACLGIGLWLTALNVRYRDFRYVIPFVVQFGLFISPVGYSSSAIPEKWRLLYSLNPMAGVIEGMRYSFFGVYDGNFQRDLVCSVVVTVLLAVGGWTYFRRVERSIADVI